MARPIHEALPVDWQIRALDTASIAVGCLLFDQVFDVTRLDETGSTMEVRRLGHPVVVADERWRPTAAGLCWAVEMTIGSPEPGLRMIAGALVRRRI